MRSDANVKVLERATSYLKFFADIKLLDPHNKYDSHRRCCEAMFHRKYQPGQFVCKYGSLFFTQGDNPDEFYIVLNGDVGIFIPRTDDEISRETIALNTLRSMARDAELGSEVEFEAFSTRLNLVKLSIEDQKFISHISKFTENTVTFKVYYLEEKLGRLPLKMLENEAFFNTVGKGQLRIPFSSSRIETRLKKAACSERTPSSTECPEMPTASQWRRLTWVYSTSKATT
jgi:hypothetical protein